MTLALQLVQFYAPFVGLLGVVFWLGVLSERVKGLGKDVADLKTEGAIDNTGDRLVRVETKMEAVSDKIEGLRGEISGLHRLVANAMITKGGPMILETQ